MAVIFLPKRRDIETKMDEKRKVSRASKLKRQKEFADLMLRRDFDGDIERLCDDYGVSKAEFNKWLEEERFKDIIEKSLEKHNYEEIAVVWKALINLCEKGNIQAIKFYFALREKYTGSATPLSENLIQIIDDIPQYEDDEKWFV